MRVSVNVLSMSGNARNLCSAFARGVKAVGDKAVMRNEREFNMDDYDAAAFWGFTTECQRLVEKCRDRGIPWVYFDMGYWLRDRYFKVTLNDRHPNAYFQQRIMPHDRFKSFGLPIRPWSRVEGGHVVVAGMSGKAAWSWGLKAEDFETTMVRELQKFTKRRIIYRSKPSWREAKKIDGAEFDNNSDKDRLNKLLSGAHAVVTHHSNVGCDALLAGVPVFTRRGAAMPLALSVDIDLHRIEDPYYPEDREQWAANLAYCQWSVAEMISGQCWRYFRELIEWNSASTSTSGPTTEASPAS